MESISIPRKWFPPDADRDPNKNHAPRCVVVLVDDVTVEEAMQAVQSALPKYALRLPSDVYRHDDVYDFFAMESVAPPTKKDKGSQMNRRSLEVACQTDPPDDALRRGDETREESCQTDRRQIEEVACQTPRTDGNQSTADIDDETSGSGVARSQPLIDAPLPAKRPRLGAEQREEASERGEDEVKMEEEEGAEEVKIEEEGEGMEQYDNWSVAGGFAGSEEAASQKDASLLQSPSAVNEQSKGTHEAESSEVETQGPLLGPKEKGAESTEDGVASEESGGTEAVKTEESIDDIEDSTPEKTAGDGRVPDAIPVETEEPVSVEKEKVSTAMDGSTSADDDDGGTPPAEMEAELGVVQSQRGALVDATPPSGSSSTDQDELQQLQQHPAVQPVQQLQPAHLDDGDLPGTPGMLDAVAMDDSSLSPPSGRTSQGEEEEEDNRGQSASITLRHALSQFIPKADKKRSDNGNADCQTLKKRKLDPLLSDDEMEEDEEDEEEYTTSKKTPKRVRSGSRSLDLNAVHRCTVCSSALSLTNASCHLKSHAMIHSDEKRYKCNYCDYRSIQRSPVVRHMNNLHGVDNEEPNDRRNALREALWKQWMRKCFPLLVPLTRTPSTSERISCSICSKNVQTDTTNLLAHIVSDHSDEKLDYDDPNGVIRRFFPLVKEEVVEDVEEEEESGEDLSNSAIDDEATAAATPNKIAETPRNHPAHSIPGREAMRVHGIPKQTPCKKVVECAVCDKHISMMQKQSLTQHAMVHSGERRFHCLRCVNTSVQKEPIVKHMRAIHSIDDGEPFDRKNGLTKALWKYWLYKCFPDVDSHVKPRAEERTTTIRSKCNSCAKEILVDDRDLFAHIVSEHSDEEIDYDDPDGVKRRFFVE